MENQVSMAVKADRAEDTGIDSCAKVTEYTSNDTQKKMLKPLISNEKENIDDNYDDFSTGEADEADIKTPDNAGNIKKEAIEKAKQKLSKWSLRLFDPNRPKGPVEPPSIIPLNDEFITAFGKREKSYDESIGRTIDLDRENLDIVEIDSDEDNDEETEQDLAVISQQKGGSCKVRYNSIHQMIFFCHNLTFFTLGQD